MICIIALVVFGVLGIFSATHRAYAKEAFNCIFRRITLRKCSTGFDNKMKRKISTKLMQKNPKLGGFVFRHFELLSWIMTIAMIVSLFYIAFAIYNLSSYGNCDPQDPENCIFQPQTAEPICDCPFDIGECAVKDFQKCGTDCNCLKETCEMQNGSV